jgi:hypothetical protein
MECALVKHHDTKKRTELVAQSGSLLYLTNPVVSAIRWMSREPLRSNLLKGSSSLVCIIVNQIFRDMKKNACGFYTLVGLSVRELRPKLAF